MRLEKGTHGCDIKLVVDHVQDLVNSNVFVIHVRMLMSTYRNTQHVMFSATVV